MQPLLRSAFHPLMFFVMGIIMALQQLALQVEQALLPITGQMEEQLQPSAIYRQERILLPQRMQITVLLLPPFPLPNPEF